MPAVIGSGPEFGEISGSTITINKPAGTAEGDLLLAITWCDNDGSAAALTAPAGWATESTSSTTISGLSGFAKIFTKRATNAEPSSYVFPAPSSGIADSLGYVYRYLGVDVATPFSARPVWFNPGAGATASLVAPSVKPMSTGILMSLWMIEGIPAGTGTVTGPAGMAYGSSQTSGGFLTIGQGSTPETPEGVTGTRTGTASAGGSTSTQGYMTVSFVLANEGPAWGGVAQGPPFFGLQWVPTPQPQMTDQLVAPSGVADAGSALVGFGASAAAVKVVVASGRVGLGFAGAGQAAKRSPAAGSSTVGLTGTGTSRHVAAVAGSTQVGLAPAAAARKAAPATGRTALGLAARAGAVKVARPTSVASVGLAGAGAARKLAGVSGVVLVPLAGIGSLSAVVVRAVTARVAVGIGGQGLVVKRSPAAGAAAVGLTGQGAAAKRSPAAGSAGVGLSARAGARKVGSVTGRAAVGLSGAAGPGKRVGILARVAFGLASTGAGRRVIGVTARAAVGFSGRSSAIVELLRPGSVTGEIGPNVGPAGEIGPGAGPGNGTTSPSAGPIGEIGPGATMTGTTDGGSSLIGSIE